LNLDAGSQAGADDRAASSLACWSVATVVSTSTYVFSMGTRSDSQPQAGFFRWSC
jgi:hypothetical protein